MSNKEYNELLAQLEETQKQRNLAEANLKKLKPILQQAHDELILLKTHRVLLVGALTNAIQEIE